MRFRLVLALILLASAARADFREFKLIPVDPSLVTKMRHAAETSLQQFPELKPEDLAISIVELTNPNTIGRGDYHGDAPFYPASVIKIFFMTDLFLKNKFDVPDVPRATREMIGVSDNDATAYIVDILANTGPGLELSGRALDRFIAARRSINDDFTRMGYDISAMNKPWSFGPYGRDRQALGPDRKYRNRLTANTTTSLMTWIARRRAPESDLQLDFLARPLHPMQPDETQVVTYAGESLPEGAKLWSKAGWTSEVRHDTLYAELPDGRKFVLTIFTRGKDMESKKTLLGAIARNVFTELGEPVAPPPPPPAPPQ